MKNFVHLTGKNKITKLKEDFLMEKLKPEPVN